MSAAALPSNNIHSLSKPIVGSNDALTRKVAYLQIHV